MPVCTCAIRVFLWVINSGSLRCVKVRLLVPANLTQAPLYYLYTFTSMMMFTPTAYCVYISHIPFFYVMLPHCACDSHFLLQQYVIMHRVGIITNSTSHSLHVYIFHQLFLLLTFCNQNNEGKKRKKQRNNYAQRLVHFPAS